MMKDETLKDEILNDAQKKAFKREAYESPLDERNTVGKMELLEERAVVSKERLDVGSVIARKEIRTKTVEVPIELVEEVLVISTNYYDADSKTLLTGTGDESEVVQYVEPMLDSVTSITVNGEKIALSDNEPVEIVLSRQVASISKQTHVVQDVDIQKSRHTHTDTINVELKREELDVVEDGMLDHQADRKL